MLSGNAPLQHAWPGPSWLETGESVSWVELDGDEIIVRQHPQRAPVSGEPAGGQPFRGPAGIIRRRALLAHASDEALRARIVYAGQRARPL